MEKDTPLFVRRAYNLGLKVASNFEKLSPEVIEYYENNLDKIPPALARGFVIKKPKPEVVLELELPLDFIVRVDRSVKPKYSDLVKKLMHPELEAIGPAEYDLRKDVEEWLNDYQKEDIFEGYKIYDQQKKDNTLIDCFGLTDLLAIQTKGINVFNELYAGKTVFGWKSVAEHQNGYLVAPGLFSDGCGEVVLRWYRLDTYYDSSNPALRFLKLVLGNCVLGSGIL